MRQKVVSGIILTLFLIGILCTMLNVRSAVSWSNGGYSTDPSNPKYGTHDWIAQHALDWLPTQEKQYILDNLAAYLYGTELPDNGGAPDGIGDTTKHHVYYDSAEIMTDNASATRASTEYNNTLSFLEAKDYAKAAKNAGIMSHYIVDTAVFGHVMGSGTDWGAEVHHSDYETYVNERTSSYNAEFNSYLSFDGSLTIISTYDAAKNLAYDTTFDVDGDLTCVWIDQNYDWNNSTFRNRAGESLNLAVNYLTDVLHTLYLDSDTTPPIIETPSRTPDGDVSPNQPVKVSVNATDATSGIKNVTLSYKINNGTTWTDLPMNYNLSTNLYEATILGQLAGTLVSYKIIAYDYAENSATLDGIEPYCTYQVIPEFSSSIIPPLFIALSLITVIFTRRKLLRKLKN